MVITYKKTKDFSKEELQKLFQSVNWSSAQHPQKLKTAMSNSDTVISAWDNSELIGLINCLSDGAMTAYFHYLLVNPNYQGIGIGKKLLQDMLKIYNNYERKMLISYNTGVSFYEQQGFHKSSDKVPMFITTLTT